MRILGLISLAMFFTPMCFAGKIPTVQATKSGKVVTVIDGDTVRVLVGAEQIRVRLEGIDAPEAKQAFGQRAKEHLIDLVAGRTVDVHVTGLDRYGRTLGKLYLNGLDINQKMLSDGFAWHYTTYNLEKQYSVAESEARSEQRGLWIDAAPIAPWEFRKRN